VYHAVNIDLAINMTGQPLWMSADAAAKALRVSRATLYAYVSRGLVRSQARPGSVRERQYAREDIDRLQRRAEERRDPDKAAARVLQSGLPILESSISLIDGRALYYRGHDAVTLARTRSVAEVASLIWTGGFDTAFRHERPASLLRGTGGGAHEGFVPRAQAALIAASTRDALAFDLRTPTLVLTGWRILQLLAHIAARSRRDEPTIDRTLARAWRVKPRETGMLRAALILCADHELNVSSFTARCVASAGSNPYAVVTAGLAALEGTKHGGLTERVESMLAGLRGVRDPRSELAARLRRGDRIDGFGHPLYPGGDPRAAVLLDMLTERFAASRELAFIARVREAGSEIAGAAPTIDFALAAVGRVLRLPAGSPLTLFAIGRTIGWIGHAIEQYATGQLIRPRAKYVGPAPTVS
jgi:citrate synthase